MRDPVYIIAEAGVNHNGQLDKALQLVEVAAESGADAVKFQTFKAESLVTTHASKANYQIRNTGSNESQYEMLKKLELSPSDHIFLKARCEQFGIEFLSTAFDPASLKFLVDKMGVDRLKVGSGELTNAPLLLNHAQSRKKLIISTGMSNLAEIEAALAVVAFGGTTSFDEAPCKEAFYRAYSSQVGQQYIRDTVTLLHCTTEYPAPFDSVNLNVISTLRQCFGVSVGYSDHTPGISISLASVALGVTVLEKHLTLDRKLPGPDHKASLEPAEFKAMVDGVREIESSLGSGIKRTTSVEEQNAKVARKSLVAEGAIKKGQFFSDQNLVVKRPGTGINPIDYWDYLGRPADQDYEDGELIGWSLK